MSDKLLEELLDEVNEAEVQLLNALQKKNWPTKLHKLLDNLLTANMCVKKHVYKNYISEKPKKGKNTNYKYITYK